jgi:zinc protease
MPRPGIFFAALWLALALRLSATPWSTATSDLPPDPSVRWGVLPNGLRYGIMPNHEPKGRVSLRLLVSAGSLHERDDERGLAHFIEHMAFRGTTAYPRGALVPALEHAGIALGPDNTAFTTPRYTIYHLELPDAHEQMMRLGLGVFYEYASNITFDPDLIELERGVVLNEKAIRDTPEARIGEANQAFLWPDTRLVHRAPIGLEEAVRHFTRDQFVAFYNAWYRPERLAVIVVGDVEPDAAARLITEIFTPLQARGPAREEPADLSPAKAGPVNIAVFSDPTWTGMNFALEHPLPQPQPNDTHERRVLGLHRALSFAILQKRLEAETHQAVGNFVAPVVSISSMDPFWQLCSVSVSGSSQNWQPLAAGLEQQHRRAFQHGFTAEELRIAKIQFTAGYEAAVRTAGTRTSPGLASDLCGVLLFGGTLSTPAELQKDITPDLEAATPADCLKAFRSAWSNDAPHVFLAINAGASIARNDVLKVLNQSRNVVVTPPEEKATPVFAYTDFGPPGKLKHDEHVEDLDVRLTEFENGVRLNFKPTAFEADNIQFALRVGTGRIGQPKELNGLPLFADAALMSGGIHRHTIDELNALMAGHNLAISFSVLDDACLFSGRCARRELPLCLQLLAAYLTDAAFDNGMIRQVHASLTSIYAGIVNSPGGPIQASAEAVMTNDRRFGLPNVDDVFSRDYAELAKWLGPELKEGDVELSLVGDTTWDEVREAASRTVGALAPRTRPHRTAISGQPVQFIKVRNAVAFTTNPTLTQSTVAFFWPAPDVKSAPQDRRSVVTAAIIAERVRERLREQLGATYTPSAEFMRHDAFPGFSYFAVTADVSPAHASQAAQIIAQEITELRTKGVTADVFTRVRQPYLRAREDDVRENSYWLFTVLSDAQQNPARLDAARSRSADNAAITREDVNAVLKRYFSSADVFLFSTYPSTAGAGKVAVGAARQGTPDRPPQPLKQDKPVYPFNLRAKGIKGTVLVEFVIDADGKVAVAKAIQSPNEELSKAAEEAVLKWKFVPGQQNGKNVPTRMRVPVNFDLDPPAKK